MTTTSEEQPEKEAKEWTEIETLKGSRLGSLMVDLAENLNQQDDLVSREKAIRGLIEELVQTLPQQTIECSAAQLSARWEPETKTYTLDKGLLVKAGVLPDQIKAGLREGKNKAHLTIRKHKPTPEDSTSNS